MRGGRGGGHGGAGWAGWGGVGCQERATSVCTQKRGSGGDFGQWGGEGQGGVSGEGLGGAGSGGVGGRMKVCRGVWVEQRWDKVGLGHSGVRGVEC